MEIEEKKRDLEYAIIYVILFYNFYELNYTEMKKYNDTLVLTKRIHREFHFV